MFQFNVFTYNITDDSITEIQEVSLGASYFRMKVEITDDHQYISVNYNREAHIYSFNVGTNQFDLWQSWTGRSADVFHAVLN